MNSPYPRSGLSSKTNKAGFLLLKRTSAEYGGWCLPGGKVDYGQEALDAVKNELIEETSLILDHAQFLFYQDSLPQAPGKDALPEPVFPVPGFRRIEAQRGVQRSRLGRPGRAEKNTI